MRIDVNVSEKDRKKIDAYGGPTKVINKWLQEIGNVAKESDFLFSTEATNQEIYTYLKDHPEASIFLYKKYKNNQEFIKELCDPKNPIFIPSVAEYLKDVIDIETVEKDLSQLQNKQIKLQHEIGLLEEELQESKTNNEKELSDLKNSISLKTSELSSLTSKLQILSAIESMKLLSNAFVQMDKISREIEDQFPVTHNHGWNARDVLVPTAALRTVKDNLDKLKQLMNTDQLVPQELIDRRRLERDAENQKLLLMTNYAVDHHILKVHEKVINDINFILKQTQGRDEITPL